ncbi:MAG: GNAT family N-acetyltransferase [Pirellulales bacterium]|nr:GNAT family N-acetyltransferase [Pirellulales bacterium]
MSVTPDSAAPAPAGKIVPMTQDMIPQVVAMHVQAFQGQMSAMMGPRYVRAMVEWFLRFPDGITLVATLDGSTPHGYVMGAPVGYSRQMNRDLFVLALGVAMTRPWIVFNGKIRRTAWSRVKLLAGQKSAGNPEPPLPQPTMSLVGIGVSPAAQRRNLGQLLVGAFEAEAARRQMRSVRLSVFPRNQAARALYAKCGWHPYLEPDRDDVTVFYSKVLQG